MWKQKKEREREKGREGSESGRDLRDSQRSHYFTPEEANKKLREVRPLVSRIVELKKLADRCTRASRERYRIVGEIGVRIAKLEEMGIEMKDLDTGLIDFPALRFGEPVYLCWRLGESEVSHWHDRTEGFRGRKLLKPEVAAIR